MNQRTLSRVLFVALLLLPTLIMAESNDGMKETQSYITGGAKIAGLLLIIAVNLMWLIFPAGLGFMTYGYFKRKSEQAQEDLGLRAGISVFFAMLVGAMGAFFVVGSIGKMADPSAATTTLQQGNEFIVSKFLGTMIDKIKTDFAPTAGTTGTTPP